MSEAAGNLPSRTFVAISHADAALTKIVFSLPDISRLTVSGSEGLLLIHQISA
jgi:hypothetical protein